MTNSPSFASSRLRVNEILEQHFDTAFAAPAGIARLRELILTLAMQGKLVEQDPNDPPASELLKEIEKERASREGAKTRRKEKKLPPIKVEEVPYELPRGWEWVRLGEIGIINPRNDAKDSELAGFVPMPLIPEGYSEKHQFEERQWSEIKKGYTHFADGDVGMAKITPCFENAKSCVFSGLPNGIGAGTTELHIFRNTFNSVVPRFLLYYLKNPHYISRAVLNMTGSAGQKRVPTPYFAEQLFPLPPLPEQHRIVARIDQLIARCNELEKLRKEREAKRLAVHAAAFKQLLDPTFAPSRLRVSQDSSNLGAYVPSCEPFAFLAQHFGELYTVKENVAELRKAILQLAAMGRLVPQDPNDPPASELLKEIESEKQRLTASSSPRRRGSSKPLPPIKPEEAPYELPEGWKFVRLGGLANFIDYRGKTPKKVDHGVPLITAKNIRFGYIDREPREFVTSEEYDSWMTRGFPKLGDLLFTTEAPLGNIAVVDIDEPFALAQRAICFGLYNQGMSTYLKWLIMSPSTQKLLSNNATGMTAKGIKAARLKELLLPIPPLPEQHRIVARIDQLMALCDTLDQQIDAATSKQSELLNAVMAGEVDDALRDHRSRGE